MIDVIVLATAKAQWTLHGVAAANITKTHHELHVIDPCSFNTAVASFSPITLKVQSCLDTTDYSSITRRWRNQGCRLCPGFDAGPLQTLQSCHHDQVAPEDPLA